jgi:general secretion pathway protein C
MQSKILPLALTSLVWALAVGSAVAWGLQWSGRFLNTPRATSSTVASGLPGSEGALVDPSAVGRLLGAVETTTVAVVAPSTASRLALLGVVTSRDSTGDAALIAVDGKPPRPFVVGSQVIDGLVLRSVTPRQAMLGASLDAPPSLTLDMPARKGAEPAAPGASAAG